jgi:4-amino-4-deoxy-L-arabinose transferase-like glycosyltransferase
VPTLAGEPFLEKPPLLFLTAAAAVRVFSPWLQPHDAARLASAFFMLLTVLLLALLEGELHGRKYGTTAAVAFIGCTGLQITAHKLITDVALLTGFAAAFYGLVLARRRFAVGGFWLGMGAGIGFLSKGLLAPGILFILALILPVVSREWKSEHYGKSLLIACIASIPWMTIWPLALYLRSPDLFVEWFWYQNLGRFAGYAHGGRRFSSLSYFTILPWFAMPTLPLGLWTLWGQRSRTNLKRPEVLFPLTVFVVMFAVFSLSSSILPSGASCATDATPFLSGRPA